MTDYPKPTTALPWPKDHYPIRYSDLPYANHAANAFPYLIEALELISQGAGPATAIASEALAIARGEVTP